MSTIKCDVYRINFPQKLLQEVLLQITLTGSFEPIQPTFSYEDPKITEKIQKLETKYKKAKELVSLLSKYSDEKAEKDKLTDYENISPEDFAKISKKINQMQAEYDHLSLEKKNKDSEISKLKDISDLDIKITSSGELFKTKLLVMDINDYDEIKYDLRDNDLINLELLKSVDKISYVLVIFDPSVEKVIDDIIEAKKIEFLSISEKKPVSIKDHFELKLEESKKIADKIEKLEEKISKFSDKNLKNLRAYTELLKLNLTSLSSIKYVGYSFSKDYKHQHEDSAKKIIQDVISKIELFDTHIKKSEVLHIDGWVIPERADVLGSALTKISDKIKVIKLDREKLSDSRSSLKNSRVFQPFETVTGLMGTPGADEIDPSPYVAPFFVTFFGFALGDAGYGLVLVLASLYALKALKLGREVQNGVVLMLYCGISTVFFGALTGGWFGADLAAVGSVGEFLAQFKVFDIASNIILVLVGSLIIGFIHQIFGLILSMYSHIKNNEVAKAFWGPGTWILFLLTIVAYVAKDVFGIGSLPWASILIVILGLFSWGQGYGTKNVLIRPLKGATAIFGITSYLSNTLSYARLLALALATGVIASVVNLLASLFSGDIPVVSQLIAAVILVIGHAFNLILNLVGTFINVARLHLVEFFPHFFDAQGVSIQPLKFDSEYIIIGEDANALDIGTIAM